MTSNLEMESSNKSSEVNKSVRPHLAAAYFGYIGRNNATQQSIWQALITIYIPELARFGGRRKITTPRSVESRLSLKDN